MTRTATRLARLAATFHARPRPPSTIEEQIALMTTPERVARIRQLEIEAITLGREANLGRPLTEAEHEEVAAEQREMVAARNAEARARFDAEWKER